MRKTLPRLSIFVLGGTGFVGKHLCARLVRAGHDVTVLTRSRARHRDLLVLPTLRLVEGDPYDAAALSKLISGCHAVVNLVGIANERGRDGSGFYRAHVDLAQQLVAACETAGVRRLIQFSTLKADPDGPSHFLRTKGEAEQIVRASALDWTILQPSVVFGPQDRFIMRLARLARRLPALPLARANARLAPVFVGDVAEAILRVLRSRAAIGKTYQLCGPRVFSMRELAQLVIQASGKPGLIVPLSPSTAKLQSRLLDFLPNKPFSTDNYLTLSVHSICDSSAPGLRDLGVRPTALEPTLRRILGRRPDRYPAPGSEA